VLTVLVILAVLGILFGAAALATYEGDILKDPHPNDRAAELPPTQLQPEDVAELRFDLALRGYRMSEVDAAMSRLGEELAVRDSRIAQLEQALVDVVEPAVTAAEQELASAPVDTPEAPVEQTPEEPPPAPVEVFEPLTPPAAAPAVISGPLTATTWFTEPAPEPEPEPVDVPAEEPVASAPVDTWPTAEEQTQEPEPVDVPDEEPVASAPVDTWPTAEEQTQEPEPVDVPDDEPVASAPVDTWPTAEEQTQEPEPFAEEPTEEPTHGVEPEALTLPAGDEAFSFPELEPPEPADDEETPEQPSDWWADHTDRP
jgi:DivIVA domain-containing protein